MIPNWTQEDVDSLAQVNCVYMIYGKEVAPTTGMPHLQGFVSFKSASTMSAVSSKIRGHLTAVTCRPWDAVEYCKKEGDFTERGTAPKNPGKRERDDWDGYLGLIKEGRSEEIPAKIQFSHFRAIQGLSSKYRKVNPEIEGDFTNEWIWGDPGTGKSYTARRENPGCFIKSANKWWDGYRDEEVVLIEDLDKDWPQFAHWLKIWADRYSFPAEVKGGMIMARPKKIVVTSNYCIQALCDKCQVDEKTMLAVLRRFRERVMMEKFVPQCD